MAEAYHENPTETVASFENEQRGAAGDIKRLNPIAKALLEGIYDEGSELARLRGMWHILRHIWRFMIAFYKDNIKVTEVLNPYKTESDKMQNCKRGASYLNLSGFSPKFPIYVAPSDIQEGDLWLVRQQGWQQHYRGGFGGVKFPKPTGININMMPFIMDVSNFKSCHLPQYLKSYWQNIIRYCPLQFGNDEFGKIGFLTIHESCVNKGETQRRPGIHTERPGMVKLQMKQGDQDDISSITNDSTKVLRVARNGESVNVMRLGNRRWGHGEYIIEEARMEGGIYMASNASDSCKLYNCEIMNDDLIGELGDIEHLREFLPQGEVLEKNNLYWFTDRTPHEALPLQEGMYRQFFRLVTSQVSLWYVDHSTKNPLGIVPNPDITKIVAGSKFDKKGVILVESLAGSPNKKKGIKEWLKSKKVSKK